MAVEMTDLDRVDRILAKVGDRFLPNKINRRLLANDIIAALDFYSGCRNESRKSVSTERRKLAADIAKTAGELSRLLENAKHGKWAQRRLAIAFPHPLHGGDLGEPSFGALASGIRELKFFAERVAARSEPGNSLVRGHLKRARPDLALGVTPLMWLLGGDLVQIYQQHFRRSAGRSRSSDGATGPGGPYVRFARAVMQEFAEPVSAHTVEAAIKRARPELARINAEWVQN